MQQKSLRVIACYSEADQEKRICLPIFPNPLRVRIPWSCPKESTESVTARNFESKRVAMNFLGSLATIGNTITAETVASFG